jgi:hypothetical protein
MFGGGADLGGEKDVPKAVDIEFFKVIIGEIQFESSFEIFDASFNLVSVEGGD